MALADDPDANVRFQVALALGGWNDDRIIAPLARIARAGAGDKWTRLAVASAVPERAGALIAALVRPDEGSAPPASHRARSHWCASWRRWSGPGTTGRTSPACSKRCWPLEGPDAARWQLAGFDGLVEGLSRRGTKLADVLKAAAEVGRQPRTDRCSSRASWT